MLSKMLRGSVNNTTNPTIPTDPNFNQVSLLLHGDGTNGAQNNTFLDSSTNNFTVTRNGNTTQGTNTPFSQAAGYWSNYLNGSSYFTVPNNTALNIPVATVGFTIELSFYLTAAQTDMGLIDKYDAGGNGYILRLLPTGIRFYQTSGAVLQDRTYTFAQGAWYHVAVSYNGTVAAIYVNGVQQGATFACVTSNSTTQLNIGLTNTTSMYFIGYISNVRYVNGTGVYTANFTPPTTPLTAITNTSLLTCQSSYFKDNSSNNFALTVTGTPSVQPFSPFAPTSAYSTSVNGGSMYFIGNNTNYLSVPVSSSFSLTGDFTIEVFVYIPVGTTQTDYSTIYGGATANNPGLFSSFALNNQFTFYSFTPSINIGTGIISNDGAWHHMAVVRSGSTITVYIDGISRGTATNSGTINFGSTTAGRIGAAANGNADNPFLGYISNLRVVKGTAVYTSNFTPPTAPLTAITNTSLLLSGTNAGIYDNAIKNDLETVGSTQVSTAVVKYGTGSMKFNGTTDYLTLPSTPNLAMGSGNFTWECWVYTSAGSSFQAFISSREGSGNTGLYLGTNNATLQPMVYDDTNPLISGSINITANTWTHVALVRNSGTLTLYIGGTSAGSVANTTNLTSTFYKIGCNGKASQNLFLNGYIDDLRITKGIARYTANFTPPTSAFPNQ